MAMSDREFTRILFTTLTLLSIFGVLGFVIAVAE